MFFGYHSTTYLNKIFFTGIIDNNHIKQPHFLLFHTNQTISSSIHSKTLEPILKPIISINPYPSIILNEFIIHRQSITEMKDIVVVDKNNIFKGTNFVKLVTFPFLPSHLYAFSYS